MSDRDPRPQTTTLWSHPSQQHGDRTFGDPRYEGRTPSFVIHEVVERCTAPGDLVVDPFSGGGTTLDVAKALGRRARGFDLTAGDRPAVGAGGLAASRGKPRVELADARDLPLEDGCARLVFMDPPYSTHLAYSEDPRCIGRLSAFEPGYFEAMAAAFAEARRVLAPGGTLAVYVSDSFEKGRGFVGIGARFFALLERDWEPLDHVAVVRGNRNLERDDFHRAAAEGGFLLRGFNHLLLFRRP